MKKKVLIIPSWYPTEDNPVLGSFFKEQAELMSENFDVCVLVGYPRLIGKKKYVTFFFKKEQVNYKENKVNDSFKEIYFEYNEIVFTKFEKRIIKQINLYEKVIIKLNKEEWIPDIIHAQSILNAGVISQVLGEKTNTPVIVTEHIPIILKNFNDKRKRIFLDAISKIKYMSVVSNFAKRGMLENVLKKNILVVGNLVDDKLFKIKENKKESNIFNIGYVGSLYHRKDPFTFIDAIALVIEKYSNLKITANIVIAGGSGNISYKEIKQYTKQKKIENIFFFYENKNRYQIANLYQEMDLIISTSISETFGLVVAEALMSGIPVIATDNGGVRDIIEHEKNGIIVNLKDADAIAENIFKIYNKEIQFNSKKIRESVKKKFGRSEFLKKMTDIYNEIIDE